jgi:hypothetical protein
MRSIVSVLGCTGFVTASTTLQVYNPEGKLDRSVIHASGQRFFAGLVGAATYCPDNVGDACPRNINKTCVAGLMGAMAVSDTCPSMRLLISLTRHFQTMVPGGQQIFIAPSGEVSYTQAHSAAMPVGSTTEGWYNKTVISNCAPEITVADWVLKDPVGAPSAGGILLCPAIRDGVFQLYVHATGFNQTGCTPIVGVVQPWEATQYCAWQYT